MDSSFWPVALGVVAVALLGVAALFDACKGDAE